MLGKLIQKNQATKAVAFAGLLLNFPSSASEVENLNKVFSENTVETGRFLAESDYFYLKKQGDEYLYHFNASGSGTSAQVRLNWKPTHIQSLRNGLVAIASLKANGHVGAQSKLALYENSVRLLELDSVQSFKLARSGNSILVLRELEGKTAAQLYDKLGNLLSERTWNSILSGESLTYSISPSGDQFLPRPQSSDIERWHSLKSFRGSNFSDELTFEFGDSQLNDAIALDGGKLVALVDGKILHFQSHELTWSFAPETTSIKLDSLQLSDNADYILAQESNGAAFYILNTLGEVIYSHQKAGLSAQLRLRAGSVNDPKSERRYEFDGEYLLIRNMDSILTLNLKSGNQKVTPADHNLLDFSPRAGKLLERKLELIQTRTAPK